jgi:hypothetical protein
LVLLQILEKRLCDVDVLLVVYDHVVLVESTVLQIHVEALVKRLIRLSVVWLDWVEIVVILMKLLCLNDVLHFTSEILALVQVLRIVVGVDELLAEVVLLIVKGHADIGRTPLGLCTQIDGSVGILK